MWGVSRKSVFKSADLSASVAVRYCAASGMPHAKNGISLQDLLIAALRKNGRPKPDGVSARTWVKTNSSHIREFSRSTGSNKVLAPAVEKAREDDGFLRSFEWRRLRMVAIKMHGARCKCCGASPKSGAVINVDHILPRKTHPHLALALDNLQVLCDACNHGKGNWDSTDWR